MACLAQPIPEVDNHLQRLINLGKRSMDHSTTRSYDKIHLYSKALVPMRNAQSLHELLGCGSGRELEHTTPRRATLQFESTISALGAVHIACVVHPLHVCAAAAPPPREASLGAPAAALVVLLDAPLAAGGVVVSARRGGCKRDSRDCYERPAIAIASTAATSKPCRLPCLRGRSSLARRLWRWLWRVPLP